MLNRYYYLLATGMSAFVASMAIYFIATEPPETNNLRALTDTQYREHRVDGPIQPLPELLTFDREWARLGKALFNSTLLSADNSISCASCHLVNYGGDDGFPVSTGVNSQTGNRNSPTVLNSVFNFRQFWDGRSQTLAEQVNGPIHDSVEMATNWRDITAKLSDQPLFVNAFKELGIDEISEESVIKAITIYEETLITPGAAIDRYLLGDNDALNEQQKRGYEKFVSLGCVTCHQGRNIGGNFYQKIGRLNLAPAQLLEDLGLYEQTKQESDKHVFKVPSLRNVALTAPYFHNGSIDTLDEAVKLMARLQLGIDLSDDDASDIVALLHAFTGNVTEIESL